MTAATQRSEQAEILLAEVETSPGSGVFEVDERLRAEEVTLASDGDISTARLSVLLDTVFDTAAARARYHMDLRLIVRTHTADATERVVLFEGYPPAQEAHWHGGPGRGDESFGFTASHVYERLAQDRRSWIYGRRMRSGRIQDGLVSDPTAWADRSILVEALPCAFNLDGAANCSPNPLIVPGPDGSPRSIHVFTYDDDPAGIPWTYLNALRYLYWFYAPREGPVHEGNVFDATDAFVDEPPSTGVTSTSRLIDRLLRPCPTLNCEATNLVEALALLAEAAGVHVTVETGTYGIGVRSTLRVWAAGDGSRRNLALAPAGINKDGTQRFVATSLPAPDVFRANQIAAADMVWDGRPIVNAPIVIGDVLAYEMTVPLVPGWVPTENLDNVAEADRQAAKDLALTPVQVEELGEQAKLAPWYRKYHRDGAEFVDNRYVGRRWVLNEDGRFDGSTFNRNAPFDDYQPFDFATVMSGELTRRGAWSRRSRALRQTITRTELGATFGVYVEVSFDGGTNWSKPQGTVDVLRSPTGITFEAANPTSVTPPGVDPEEQNMWYAIIDQTFRVRVTAVIEGDDRLVAQAEPESTRSPTLQVTSRIVYRPTVYRFVTRSGTTNVLAQINAEATDLERDDAADIALAAATVAEREAGRRVTAAPVIPWLDGDFAIGDEVRGVGGRGVSFLAGDAGASIGPVVVGKRFRLGGGRWQTELVLSRPDVGP